LKLKNQFSKKQWKKKLYLERICLVCQQSNPSLAQSTIIHSVAPLINPQVKDVKEWTVDEVVTWASSIQGFKKADIDKLRSQRITGKALLEHTFSIFRSYGIPGGPALILSKEIEKLNASASQGDILYKNNRSLSFLIKGRATIKHYEASFDCDLLVDTGSSLELILPLAKAKQLKLKPEKSILGDGIGKIDIPIEVFRPEVILILKDENGNHHQFFLKVASVGYLTEEEKTEMEQVADDYTQEALERDLNGVLYDIPLCPVFENSPKYLREEPVLGFKGLVRMGVDIDFEQNILRKAKERV